MSRVKRTMLVIELPHEFLEWCEYDMVKPETILLGFIADLLGTTGCTSHPGEDEYNCHGSTQRDAALAYYDSVGYAFEAEWIRKNLSHLVNSQCPRDATEFKMSPIAAQATGKHMYTPHLLPLGGQQKPACTQEANLNCRDRDCS